MAAASDAPPASDSEFEVDPWSVSGNVDYEKLIIKFGSGLNKSDVLSPISSCQMTLSFRANHGGVDQSLRKIDREESSPPHAERIFFLPSLFWRNLGQI